MTVGRPTFNFFYLTLLCVVIIIDWLGTVIDIIRLKLLSIALQTLAKLFTNHLQKFQNI